MRSVLGGPSAERRSWTLRAHRNVIVLWPTLMAIFNFLTLFEVFWPEVCVPPLALTRMHAPRPNDGFSRTVLLLCIICKMRIQD